MFAKIRHRRQSNATPKDPQPVQHEDFPRRSTATASSSFSKASGNRLSKATPRGQQPESPLHLRTFHWGSSTASLPEPFRPFASSDRPSTSDGYTKSGHAHTPSNASSVSLLPPVLPPIPRVASVYGKPSNLRLDISQERWKDRQIEALTEDEPLMPHSLGLTTTSRATTASAASPHMSPFQELDTTRRRMDPAFFSDAPAEGKMEATMFPSPSIAADQAPPPIPPRGDAPAMNRAFVDSRDKSYYPSGQRQSSAEKLSTQPMPPRSSSIFAGESGQPSIRAFENSSTTSPMSTFANPLRPPSISGSRLSSVSAQSSGSPNNNPPSSLGGRSVSGASMDSRSIPVEPPRASSAVPLATNPRNVSRDTSASALSDHPVFRPPRPMLITTRSDSNLLQRAQAQEVESSSTRSKRTESFTPSEGPPSTLGTPYDQTSPAFPLPQLVTTRPQTSGITATVAGVTIPTHHTSAMKKPEPTKAEPHTADPKRRTRLLRPLAFFSRKRSTQEEEPVIKISEEERTAQLQAFARQKSVAAAGVNKLPKDFDPRIRGNVVHDFSSPRRHTRSSSVFGSDASALGHGGEESHPSSHNKQSSQASMRQSTHSAVFREHLTEETDASKRLSSIEAEKLENKDFVQRVSRQSINSLPQDSSMLPPFARRTQPWEPSHMASVDQDSMRSSAVSSGPYHSKDSSGISHNKKESSSSSFSQVSPITARNSGFAPVKESDSPVSPNSLRPASTVEALPKPSDHAEPVPTTLGTADPAAGDESTAAVQPAVAKDEPLISSSPVPRDDTCSQPPPASTPEAPTSITWTPNTMSPSPAEGTTPISIAKRAVSGKSTKNSGMPRHHASNASRFSFQIGERNPEEAALEEKHRRIARDASQPRPFSPDEDEDDYFDEDAMDDLDEMEMQEHGFRDDFAESNSAKAWNMQDAQRQMQYDPDDTDTSTSDYEEERPDTSYSWQQTPQEEFGQNHFRLPSDTSVMTADTNIMIQTPMRDTFPVSRGSAPTGGFQFQPRAAGYAQHTGSPTSNLVEKPLRPPLPHRDSGNSERNRIASGLSFPPQVTSASTAETLADESTGAKGNFSAFNFDDDEELAAFHSGESSTVPAPASFMLHHRAQDSDTLPLSGRWSDLNRQIAAREPSMKRPTTAGKESAPYAGRIGAGIRARNDNVNQNSQYADDDEAGDDDLYFDDGGFDQDIRRTPSFGNPLDENSFDDPTFLSRKPGGHLRDRSDVTMTSHSSDGPYPSFAMGSNSANVLRRESQLLLEDLPLQNTVDPKWIPQRNPSEDFKRLGLSLKMPPLPPASANKEAVSQMQHSLDAYHAVLAEAANKAAAEGRFARMASAATSRSVSVRDDQSHYSQDSEMPPPKEVSIGLKRNISVDTSLPKPSGQTVYSPPKLSFDFGFENPAGLEDFDVGNPTALENMDDFEAADDDIIAAANAEALAFDESFYGQEFDFYAKARPNSSDAEPTNGGFFGEYGDDGFGREMYFKEPNLTPITERSEFSTRNSFVHLGHGPLYGPPSAGPMGPNSPAMSRLAISPLLEHEATSFEQLRQLRKSAFGGSESSLGSEGRGTGPRPLANQSPTLSSRSPAMGSHNAPFGPPSGFESGDSGDSNYPPPHFQESPRSSPSSGPNSAAVDNDATPRKGTYPASFDTTPKAVRKASAASANRSSPTQVQGPSHSRKSSDSVTYVREDDPAGTGQPRWVLERRRTSEQGRLELVGREVVQGGWI